jgi:hypothetical protein
MPLQCNECLFWQVSGEDLSVGTCRKKTPGSYQYLIPQRSLQGVQFVPHVTSFPVIRAVDWCSEYEGKPAKPSIFPEATEG